MIMFQSSPEFWPIGSSASATPSQLRGGIAPLRHELALANYVEKQAKFRESGIPIGPGIVDSCRVVWSACIVGCRVLAAFASDRPGNRIA